MIYVSNVYNNWGNNDWGNSDIRIQRISQSPLSWTDDTVNFEN